MTPPLRSDWAVLTGFLCELELIIWILWLSVCVHCLLSAINLWTQKRPHFWTSQLGTWSYNVCLHLVLILGYLRSKIRSNKKHNQTCAPQMPHFLSQSAKKLGQNVCLNSILDMEFDNGSCEVKNQVTSTNGILCEHRGHFFAAISIKLHQKFVSIKSWAILRMDI